METIITPRLLFIYFFNRVDEAQLHRQEVHAAKHEEEKKEAAW